MILVLRTYILHRSCSCSSIFQWTFLISAQAERFCASRSEARIDFESTAHRQGSRNCAACKAAFLFFLPAPTTCSMALDAFWHVFTDLWLDLLCCVYPFQGSYRFTVPNPDDRQWWNDTMRSALVNEYSLLLSLGARTT